MVGSMSRLRSRQITSSELSYRDDLESLAYTLIEVLSAKLPWTFYYGCSDSTKTSATRQVFEYKTRCNGQRVGAGLPPVFGALVDYARSLEFCDVPDFERWQRMFRDCDGGLPVTVASSSTLR